MIHECFIYDGLLVDLADCVLAPLLVRDVLDNDGASVYNMRVHEETIISWNNDVQFMCRVVLYLHRFVANGTQIFVLPLKFRRLG